MVVDTERGARGKKSYNPARMDIVTVQLPARGGAALALPLCRVAAL